MNVISLFELHAKGNIIIQLGDIVSKFIFFSLYTIEVQSSNYCYYYNIVDMMELYATIRFPIEMKKENEQIPSNSQEANE